MRGAGAVVAGLVVVSGLVLGPQAESARALVSPPPVASLPSSVLGSLAGTSTAAEAVGGLTATGGTAVTTGAAGTGLVAAEAAGGTVAVGLVIGTSAGTQIASAMGLTTSGSFVCDVQWLIWSDAACATAAGEDWSVNADAVGGVAGWASGVNVLSVAATSDTVASTVTATVSGPDSGSAGLVTLTMMPGVSTLLRWSYAIEVVSSSGGGWVSRGAGGTFSRGTAKVVTVSVATGERYRVRVFEQADSSNAIGWWPVGDADRPADPDANPSRTWVTTWQCSDGTSLSATSAAFHETDSTWPAIPQAACEASAITQTLVQEVGSNGTTTTILDWTAPSALTDWASTATGQECIGGGCELLLYRVDSQTGARISCQEYSSVCADWWTETSQATAALDQYECQYNGEVLALSECTVYAHAFDQGVYSDPRTGETVDSATTPEVSDASCPPPFSWTALWNTWWYYKAGVCAMEEVFVPQTALQTAQVTQAWQSSALGEIGDVVSNLGSGFAAIGGGECGVITDSEPVPLLGWHLVVDTCGWPWSAAGPLKRIIGLAFLLGSVIIGVRTVLRIIRADVVVDGSSK